MKDRNMWKKWRDYRLDNPTDYPGLNEIITEGEDETLKSLGEGMLAAVQNLVPTLTNFAKMTTIFMNPKDPKKSKEENELRLQSARNSLNDLQENAKLLVQNYKFIIKYIEDEYGFSVESGKKDKKKKDG
tara:strand:+ start:1064 stop:1453 length:390 start_codon:yes stop_codon:yes gene_type:complete